MSTLRGVDLRARRFGRVWRIAGSESTRYEKSRGSAA